MGELKGKRLLVLGGNPWFPAIQQFVKDNEITLIAAGNNENNDLFRYADESYLVDSTDYAAMKQLITDKKIDGVYMGGTEPVISVACEYINELGLPCYCNKTQWEYLQNKRNFKELCIRVGLPVVPRYKVSAENCCLPEDVFPVITKPEDGSGSNGFSVCRNNDELKRGYEKAAQDSPTGSVIVERFVKNEGVVCFYTVSDGKVHFSGLSDKFPVKFQKQGSYVGGLFVYESSFEREFREKFEGKIQEIVTILGIKEGPFWIEVFRDNGVYYFNEVGFRYGGSVSVYSIDYLFGINQVAADIYFALTGKSKIYGHPSMIGVTVPRKKHYAVYPVYLRPGEIGKVSGMDSLRAHTDIVTVIEKLGVGDVVRDKGSFGQVFALVHFVFDDEDELKAMLEWIHGEAIVTDVQNSSMIMKMLEISGLTLPGVPAEGE